MKNRLISFSQTKTAQKSGFPLPEISATSPFSTLTFDVANFSPIPAFRQGSEDPTLEALRRRVASLQNPPSPGSFALAVNKAKPIEEQLFEATANAKILTSQIAMHLDIEWRNRLFQQLDSLHDPEEWEPDDTPVQQASFATFLKAIFQLKPTIRPGLGLSSRGHLIAAWTCGKDRLTIEFMPIDRVRWVASRYPEDELEQFAGQTSVSRLRDTLNPYRPEEWLYKC